jgi:hypothetical protein
LKSGPRRERPLGNNAHRQATATARIMNVGAELAEHTANRGRGVMRSRHIAIFVLL